MRYREIVMALLGFGLIVFAVSYFIYRLIFKKELKNWKINCLMVACMIIGGVMFTPPTIQFIKQKQGQVDKNNTVIYGGKRIKTNANAKERVSLETAYDSIETTHPSVVKFDEEWNGYRYWMAVTPYPKGKATLENPHVFKSNNLVTWIPDKNNPLDEPKSEKFIDDAPFQYDSDTHIIYNKEENRLEVFWRYVDDVNDEVTIYRRDSSDGKTWTPKIPIYQAPRKAADMVSPAFIKDEEGYKVWYVQGGYKIRYRESKDGLKWTEPVEIVVPYDNTNMKHWHLDVQKTDLGYEMIVVGFESTGTNAPGERHTMNLYYSKSADNKKWDTLKPIIFPSQIEDQWDGKGLYRSAFIKENGRYYVFYSGIGFDDTRGIGLSYGDDIFNLQGVDYSDTSKLIKNK